MPTTRAIDFLNYLQTAIDFTQEGPEECGIVAVAETVVPPTLTPGIAIMNVRCVDGARFLVTVSKLAEQTTNPRNGEEDADGDAVGRMMGENR